MRQVVAHEGECPLQLHLPSAKDFLIQQDGALSSFYHRVALPEYMVCAVSQHLLGTGPWKWTLGCQWLQ